MKFKMIKYEVNSIHNLPQPCERVKGMMTLIHKNK